MSNLGQAFEIDGLQTVALVCAIGLLGSLLAMVWTSRLAEASIQQFEMLTQAAILP